MPTDHRAQDLDDQIEIDLRQPGLAALWAWLWPGAGHLYQRRYAKGILFMVCILSIYFFGLTLGRGHVVYAAWNQTPKRWQYFCQIGVGIPALPALVQAQRQKTGRPLLLDGKMAPPIINSQRDQLSEWHKEDGLRFELGTLYTMIAGLLNILAIYDAFAGPVVIASTEEEEKPPGEDTPTKGAE